MEFVIVGPRSTAMGGAGVAITTDALATYWNPAGLAMDPGTDLRAQVSAQGTDRLGTLDRIKEAQDIKEPSTLEEAQVNLVKMLHLLDKLARPGASLSAAAAGGVYLKTHYGQHAFGFTLSDVATGGAFFPKVDRNISISVGGSVVVDPNGSGSVTADRFSLKNDTELAFRGLEARQAGLSYAYASTGRTISIGTTVKLLQGVAYTNRMNILDVDFGIVTEAQSKTSTAVGVDVGAMYRPTSWLQFGIVGKDLNTPSFSTPEGGEFLLEPQFRGGLAVKPYSSLLLAADVDLLKNRTLVPSIKSQVLSLGAEQALFSDSLFLRGGLHKNLADASSIVMPTAGFGFRVFAVRIDVGGGYDFRERQALASFSIGGSF